MVESYEDYEGRDQGLLDALCEDAVLRFLQRRALLEEGGTDGGPQEIVTFGRSDVGVRVEVGVRSVGRSVSGQSEVRCQVGQGRCQVGRSAGVRSVSWGRQISR